MSQAQEERRARMWEKVHKQQHEESIAELITIKARLDAMDKNSDDYKVIKGEYDRKYEAAESFFIKFYES